VSLSGESLNKDQHTPTGVGHGVERGFTAAFELVATPVLFAVIGYFLDRRLGTGPFLTIALTVFVAGYVIWKLWYNYSAEMDRLDAARRAPAEDRAPMDPGSGSASVQ